MRAALLFVAAVLLAPWLYARWAPPIVYMENWPDGSPKRRAASVRTIHGDFVFDGPSRSLYPSGQVESQGEYRRGKENGPWRWYREDGSVLAICDFDEGDGDYRSFHPDGSIWWEGRRKDGLRSGHWVARNEEGRRIREGDYVRDQPHGEWQYWSYEDSVEHYTGRWEHGVLLEEDAPIRYDVHLRLGALEHALEFAQWSFWMLAPWPLALALSAGIRGRALALLAALSVGLCLQLLLLQLLLALGLFDRGPILLASSLLWGLGVVRWRSDSAARAWFLESFASMPRPGTGAAALCAAVLIVAMTRLWTGLVEAPTNFDALAYHLPIMADWVQSSGLVQRPELGQVAYYAFGWETLGAASMRLMDGDAFIAVPNLLAWAMLLLAAHVLGRRIGASALGSAAAAVLLLSAPEILRRLVAVQPDLALAATASSALLFSGFPRRGERALPLPLLASVALLLAVKISGWVYLLAGATLFTIFHRGLTLRSRPVFWLGAGFVGLFWYVRSLLVAGNPLGELRVGIGGWTLFDGALAPGEAYRGSLARLFEWGSAEHFVILAKALHASFGPALWLAAGCLLLSAVAARSSSRAGGRGVETLWLGVSCVLAFALYWNTPYGADNGANGYRLTSWMSTNTRFAFPAFVLLSPFVARVFTRVESWKLKWLLPVLAVLAAGWGVVDLIGPRYEILVTACLLALASCAALRRSPRLLAAVAVVFVMLFAVGSREGRVQRHESRLQLYGSAYEHVLRNYDPTERLGYAMTQNRYPFVGPRLTHRVVSAVPFREDREAWFEQLDASGIDVLLVGYGSSSESGRVNPENVRPWLMAADSPFERMSNFQSQRRDIEVWQRR